MDTILSIAQPVAAFLVVLTVLVFVHEWGHYIIARINGVRVEVFSIGFGPEIWGFNDKHGTRWKFSWIPLGGYVKFFGDGGEASTPGDGLDEMTAEERSVSFHHKKLHQKAAIVFAGPAINFLFAIFIISCMYFSYGRLVLTPEVGGVVEGGAAAAAGILPGDRILSIDGEEISSFQQIQQQLLLKVKDNISIVIVRNNEEINVDFTLTMVEREDVLGNIEKVRQIGIMNDPNKYEFVEFGLLGSVVQATIQTKNITELNLRALGQIIMGDRSAKEISGPISMARIAGKTIDYGLISFINFAAFISIGLGMVNLFPIPMLDGGHLLYYAIEAIRRKKMSAAAEEFGFKIGALVVLSLMVFSFVNDVLKI